MKKIKISQMIIMILVIGLISLIPYTMVKINSNKNFTLKKDSTFKLKELSYKIPKGFKAQIIKHDDYKYYSYQDEKYICSISIDVMNNKDYNFKDGEEYLRNKVFFTLEDEFSEITKENNWYTITKTSKSKSIEKISASLNNDNIYLFKFAISNYEDIDNEQNHKCQMAYDFVYESLKIEEK